MGRFRSPASQARFAVKKKLALGKSIQGNSGDDGKIHSLGTARTYADSLKLVATFISERRLDTTGKGLNGLSREAALTYIEYRSQVVGQKQLDKDRQALQKHLGEKLHVAKSQFEQVLISRAYTFEQVDLIAGAQSVEHKLSTKISADAGLRAHELQTLMPIADRKASAHRVWADDRFKGRGEIQRYTVAGKGGLIREVAISIALADQLESMKLAEPRVITDRGIYYTQLYAIGGGKKWSDSFSKAAQRILGWTEGAHGLRHTYAQARMKTLQSGGINYEDALSIVSQEMGHFRADITEVYLR